MSDITPGREAYEAWAARFDGLTPEDWSDLADGERVSWEAVADAGAAPLRAELDALAARLAEAESALESISAAREMRSDGELTDEGFATVVYDALDVLRAQKVARDRAALEARDA